MHYSFVSTTFSFYESLGIEKKIEDTLLNQILEPTEKYLYHTTDNPMLSKINNIQVIENPWIYYKYIHPNMKLTKFDLKILLGLEVAPTVAIVTDNDILDTLSAFIVKTMYITQNTEMATTSDPLLGILQDKVRENFVLAGKKFDIGDTPNDHIDLLSLSIDTIRHMVFEFGGYNLHSINIFNADKYIEYTKIYNDYLYVDIDYKFIIEYITERMECGKTYSTAIRELRNQYTGFVMLIR